MKKRLIFGFCTMLILSLILAGCGDGSKKSAEPASAAKPVTLKLGHVLDSNHAWNKAAVKFAELVDQKTKGTVKVQVFHSSQLGNDRDLAEGLQMGSVDMALIAGVLGNFYDGIQLLELPYLFNNQDHLKKVIYGPVGEEIKQNLQKKAGIIGFEFWERGPRELTSNKPINKI